MVRSVGNDRGNYFDPPPPPTSAQLSVIGNVLWLSTYFLFNNNNASANPYTYQLAMKGIQTFMNQFPPPPAGSGPTGSSYLYGIWEDLTSTNGAHGTSLAALAQNFTTNGYNSNDLATFNSFLSDQSMHPIFQTFEEDIDDWGSKVGPFQPNHQALTQRDFENLRNDFPLSQSNLSQFLSDVSTVEAELNASTPPLDGVCQMLQTMLNTPIDPTNANSTLSILAKNGDTAGLQTLLNNNPNFAAEVQGLLQQMGKMEGFNC